MKKKVFISHPTVGEIDGFGPKIDTSLRRACYEEHNLLLQFLQLLLGYHTFTDMVKNSPPTLQKFRKLVQRNKEFFYVRR